MTHARQISQRSMLHGPVSWALRHWATLSALSWLMSGALYLTLPPSPDQFQHAYLGWRLLEGDIPYRDIVDVNWPGVMGLHALAIYLFGINLWSWRAFDFALFAGSAFLLADLVKLAAGREAGRLSLIISPPVYAGVSYWVAGQHDMSAAQFLVGALWFHVRGYERRTWWYQIGTGLCIGVAMLNKPTVGVIGLLLPLHALWLRIPTSRILVHTSAAGVAAVASLLAALGGLLSLGTSMQEVLETIWTYNTGTQYAGDQTLPEMIFWLLQFHYRWIPMVAFGSLPGVIWIFARANRSMAGTALLVLWASGSLSYFTQWRGLTYHLAPCLVALIGSFAISVALVAAGRITIGITAWMRSIVGIVLSLALLGIGIKLIASYRSLLPALFNGDYQSHLSRFSALDDVSVADTVAFARRLEALATTDCVLLVGDATSINYLSTRRMPTRFFYYHVLANVHPAPPVADRWVELWKADLRAADCRFTLVSRVVATHWLVGTSPAAAALRQYLDRYRKTGTIGLDAGIAVYERR